MINFFFILSPNLQLLYNQDLPPRVALSRLPALELCFRDTGKWYWKWIWANKGNFTSRLFFLSLWGADFPQTLDHFSDLDWQGCAGTYPDTMCMELCFPSSERIWLFFLRESFYFIFEMPLQWYNRTTIYVRSFFFSSQSNLTETEIYSRLVEIKCICSVFILLDHSLVI